MLDESTIELQTGAQVEQVRLWCEGTKQYRHEPAQTHLFVHQVGATWPDGRDHWEFAGGLMEWQRLTGEDVPLDASRGKTFYSTSTGDERVYGESMDDVRVRVVFRCGYCTRAAVRTRRKLEDQLSMLVKTFPAATPGVWEVPLAMLAGNE